MKVKGSSLFLLILGSLSVLGLRDQPSNELAQKAVCTVECEDADFHSLDERKKCKNACNSHQRKISVLDVEAGANAKYVCQDFEWSILDIEPGTFVVEHRNQSSDWVDNRIVTTSALRYRHYGFKTSQAGLYQWRFTRVFADGISRSEITEWIQARGTASAMPRKNMDVWLQCLALRTDLYKQAISVTAQIRFRLPEDPDCFYNVTCSQEEGPYREWILINLKKRERELEAAFENLRLGANFTVRVQSQGPTIGEKYTDEAVMKFSTPSTWVPAGTASKSCVPGEVDGLNARTIRNKESNDYDVVATWQKPDYIPDFFVVNITWMSAETNERLRVFHSVSGSAINTTFKSVNISQQFNVSMKAWSLLGGGPETTKSFIILDENSNLFTPAPSSMRPRKSTQYPMVPNDV